MMKKCSKCGIEKILNDENFANSKGIWRSECRKCGNIMCREYKARNRQYISEYNKAYKSSNVLLISDYNKQYYHDNLDKMREKNLRTHKRLRATNPGFRISANMRKRISTLVSGENKSASSMELLGCDIEFFIHWLKYQFVDEMTMENYGTWQLDHVRPCADFDMTNPFDQKTCFHWTNYQPIWKIDNIIKGSKILKDTIDEHQIKALNFIDEQGDLLNLHYTLTI